MNNILLYIKIPVLKSNKKINHITYQKVTWLSLQKKINYQDNY